MATPIEIELKEFVEKFKIKNGRIPTQQEIFKGTGRAAATIKSYLAEGIEYAKPLTKLEAAKLGGKKPTGITQVSDDLIKQFKNLKFIHISPSVETTKAGSKSFRVRFTGPIANDFKDIFLPATEENLQKITNQIDDVATGNLYKNKAKQFKTPEQFRKLRRLKDAMYNKKDPYGVYEKLRKYKSKVFPGTASRDIQIQHGQPKFSTQTLSRFGFIPKDVNVSPEVEMTERIRNEKLATIKQKLKNPNISIGQKTNLVEEFNDTMKGLRGQLKGTKGQGLVNFELLDIDQDGTVTKLKDTGFDPKRGLVASDEDLSKITKQRADELVKLGKQKIDAEGVKLKLIPGDQLPIPEKSKVLNMFKNFGKAKTALPAAALAYLGTSGFGGEAEAAITYNPTIGALVKTGSDDIATQSNVLEWAAKNPEASMAGTATAGLGMTKPGSAVLKGLLKTLAAPAVGAGYAALDVKENLDEGESLPEALADKSAGLSLMGSRALMGGQGLGALLGGAKIARSLTPVGAAMTAAGIGKDYYDWASEEIERLEGMTDYERQVYSDSLMDETNIDF